MIIEPSNAVLEYEAELLHKAISALGRVFNLVEYGDEVYRLQDKLIVARDERTARIIPDPARADDPLF